MTATHKLRDDGKLLCAPHTVISALVHTSMFDTKITCQACRALMPKPRARIR